MSTAERPSAARASELDRSRTPAHLPLRPRTPGQTGAGPASVGATGEGRVTVEALECLAAGAQHGCTLTPADVQRLVLLRRRCLTGEVSETLDDSRLRFARWLYEHGRISG
jgi:hypothetical protein